MHHSEEVDVCVVGGAEERGRVEGCGRAGGV